MFSAKYAGRKVSTEILLINNVSIHGDSNYKVIRRILLITMTRPTVGLSLDHHACMYAYTTITLHVS